MKRKFLEEPSFLGYVKNCLIPYLYSFSYKCRYGQLPFGELSHGLIGIREHYLELFHLKDVQSLSGLIAILAQENYRGHVLCPCGSGKRLRSCHGGQLLEIMKLETPAYFQSLFKIIRPSSVVERRVVPGRSACRCGRSPDRPQRDSPTVCLRPLVTEEAFAYGRM